MDMRIRELHETLEPYRICNQPELVALESGRVNLEVAQALVKHYYPVNLRFPLFLAAAMSHILHEPTRQLLVQNLWEEHGSGDARNSHTELFRKFALGVGVDPSRYENAISDSPADELNIEFFKACSEGPAWKGLAVLYAFEELFSPLSNAVASGFRQANLPDIGERELKFFYVHGIADIEHAEKLRQALLETALTQEQWKSALQWVDIGARLLTNVFVTAARHYRLE